MTNLRGKQICDGYGSQSVLFATVWTEFKVKLPLALRLPPPQQGLAVLWVITQHELRFHITGEI